MNLLQKVRIAVAGLVVISVIPIPYLASPEWTVTVTDEAGRPLPGVLVDLSYQNYSVEDEDHTMKLTTNATGRVVFPAKRRVALIGSRCYFTAREVMALAHASFGPSAYVLVFGGGREGSVNVGDGSVYFWNGRPDRVTSTVVARPRDQ